MRPTTSALDLKICQTRGGKYETFYSPKAFSIQCRKYLGEFSASVVSGADSKEVGERYEMRTTRTSL